MQSTVLRISGNIVLPMNELEFTAVRSGGPGGQNVNKVATAIQLRFDICSSSLPEFSIKRLLQMRDRRVTDAGMLIIKAQNHRTQAGNRKEAVERFREIILKSMQTRTKRKMTRPSARSVASRLNRKKRHAEMKILRKKVKPETE